MTDPALVHYYVLLATFQFAAAVALLSVGRLPRLPRALLVALVAVNGGIALLAAGGSETARVRLSLALDAPTPQIILLFLLWFPRPRFSPGVRKVLAAGLIASGAVASLWSLALPITPSYRLAVFLIPVFGSYAIAVAMLARETLREPRWDVGWGLAAFSLRAADSAVVFGLNSWGVQKMAGILLSALVLASAAAILRRGVPAWMKAVVAGAVGLGAFFGLLAGLAGYSLQAALVTLAIGRPALLLVAFAPPGLLGPFFRGALVAVGAYAGTVLLAERVLHFSPIAPTFSVALGVAAAVSVAGAQAFLARAAEGRPTGPAPIALDPLRNLDGGPSPEGPRPPAEPPVTAAFGTSRVDQLLVALGSLPEGGTTSRSDLARAIGVAPRNVHRIVDAANRSGSSGPGRPRVEWTIQRGRRGQLEYRYRLAPAGTDTGEGDPAEEPARS